MKNFMAGFVESLYNKAICKKTGEMKEELE